MKKSVLVIGKLSQLGGMFQTQIIAALKKAKLIESNDQVKIFANNLSIVDLCKEQKKCSASHVCYIGLKGHMLPEYITKIERSAEKKLEHLVIATDGKVPSFSEENTVNIYANMEDLIKEDFSKEESKEAA